MLVGRSRSPSRPASGSVRGVDDRRRRLAEAGGPDRRWLGRSDSPRAAAHLAANAGRRPQAAIQDRFDAGAGWSVRRNSVVKATSSPSSVQVKSCSGLVVGWSSRPPRVQSAGRRDQPVQPQPAGGTLEVCTQRSRSIRVRRASSRRISAGRVLTVSLSRRPPYTPTPAGSPGAPAFGSSTK